MRLQTIVSALGLTLGCFGPAPAQLPAIGGAYGQTLRFVITAGDPIPTDSGASGCAALVRIVSKDLLPAAEKSFDLRPGESGFVDVNLSPLAERVRKRVELLPAVRVLRGTCTAGVEVYENFTGRTMTYVGFGALPLTAAVGQISPVGMSTGQFVRLGAARGFDPQPDPPACRAVLGFADAAGNPVGPTKTVNLAVGSFDFVDLDPGLLLPASGRRCGPSGLCGRACSFPPRAEETLADARSACRCSMS